MHEMPLGDVMQHAPFDVPGCAAAGTAISESNAITAPPNERIIQAGCFMIMPRAEKVGEGGQRMVLSREDRRFRIPDAEKLITPELMQRPIPYKIAPDSFER